MAIVETPQLWDEMILLGVHEHQTRKSERFDDGALTQIMLDKLRGGAESNDSSSHRGSGFWTPKETTSESSMRTGTSESWMSGSSSNTSSQGLVFLPIGTDNFGTKIADEAPVANTIAAHNAGQCRPCLFFQSKQGCLSGKSCRFCHMAHPPMAKLHTIKRNEAQNADARHESFDRVQSLWLSSKTTDQESM